MQHAQFERAWMAGPCVVCNLHGQKCKHESRLMARWRQEVTKGIRNKGSHVFYSVIVLIQVANNMWARFLCVCPLVCTSLSHHGYLSTLQTFGQRWAQPAFNRSLKQDFISLKANKRFYFVFLLQYINHTTLNVWLSTVGQSSPWFCFQFSSIKSVLSWLNFYFSNEIYLTGSIQTWDTWWPLHI